ncbi:ACP S-malonyltransferase [Streptomyces sp. RKND-216]|uniref:ACP S-malonyltransferase n=1 Tax=Streptomyces sp. RKND-216 TaxID=2562581 RepID=UPI00109DB074|nr:ACP S-malonyltransferase [Streptomyces sp. RKND-216]THA24098.1 ACP S-malonyltransferase [Streptomyces sp. RKND-216]
MTVLVFPGQGSQRRGMGGDLFARFPELTAAADAVVGHSIEELCRTGGDGNLDRTEYAQPALFVVNALSHLARDPALPAPRYLAGHSLGEYNALLAAGVFDFATGVRLVHRRGELMGQAAAGGMLAVLGVSGESVSALTNGADRGLVDVANLNSASQAVLSGPTDVLRDVARELSRHDGVRSVPLRVSAAFHSRYMKEAADEFAEYLREFSFADPRIPVLANVTAAPYGAGQVAELLARQMHQPVQWHRTMRYLVDHGVEDLEETGPGRVLSGLWADAKKKSATEPAGGAAGTDGVSGYGRPPSAEPAPGPVGGEGHRLVRAGELGCPEFRRDHGLRYSYLAGAMFRGIASADLVIRLGQSGLKGFFGAGGLDLGTVEKELLRIQGALGTGDRFGMNLLHSIDDPGYENAVIDLYLRHGVRTVEAAGFTQLTPAAVRFRFAGAHRDAQGAPLAPNQVIAKVSRPEVAEAFMSPAPAALVDRLVAEELLTPEEARIATELPVSGDICVEADSGGHTDGGAAFTLLPAMLWHRDAAMERHGYRKRIRVGAAGGIGAPSTVAAAFVLGADFVLTGSVNQCSVEAGTSDAVKDLLAGLDVQDTAYAPAGDMFELGARVQVVRKATMFAARGNKLYQLYRQYDAWESIDETTRRVVEETYFQRPFAQVWEEARAHHLARGRGREIEKAERSPKQRMALTFRWYFARSVTWALEGDPAQRVNFQIQCGPAIGAFNHHVRGTPMEDWRDRHVDAIAEALMTGAAEVLGRRFARLVHT